MLNPNQFAPDFNWQDASGKAQSLHGLRDRARVIVLFVRSESTVEAWQKEMEEREDEFTERDMVSLIIGPFAPLPSLRDENRSIAHSFEVGDEATAFFVIGKDGTIKRAQNELPTVDELWAQVDSMPMRQREMRERS